MTFFISPCYKRLKLQINNKIHGTPSSIFLWQAISGHDYLVSKHFARLGHNMPVQCQVEFFTSEIASLHKEQNYEQSSIYQETALDLSIQ